jgi:hypothetical protein
VEEKTMFRSSSIVLAAFLAGAVTTALVSDRVGPVDARARAAGAEDAGSNAEADVAALRAEIAMKVVDYHTTCLWFAGKAENWPLADFYWEQILLHMRRSAQSDPGRKSTPQQAKLAEALKTIEGSPSMKVDEAIRKKDLRSFNLTYRNLLQGCYDCHKAAGKPFLRPRMPLPPFQSIITVDPKAAWPG